MAETRGPEGREGQPGREGVKGREGIPGIEGAAGETGKEGQRGKTGRSISTTVKIAFGILTLIFFAVLVGFSWVVHDVRENTNETRKLVKSNALLLKENDKRILEIQDSRIVSCKQTYSGIHEVFKPLFPPKPRTQEEQDRLDTFNKTIIRLRNGCIKQTQPKEK